MEFKFIIVGPHNRSLDKIIETVSIKNDSFNICKRFINDKRYKDTANTENLYYMDNLKITEALKNNSILYVSTHNDTIYGVTIDDFYSANVLGMSVEDFNNISTNLLKDHKDDILIVWLDTKHHLDTDNMNKDIHEVSYFVDKLEEFHFNYIYLLDESRESISSIIVDYYNANGQQRSKFLEEFS